MKGPWRVRRHERAGGAHPVALAVGRDTASVTAGGSQGTGERRSCRLDPSATHGITVSAPPGRSA
ncbi:hypothetical protein B9W64_12555 [Streptomyces sp. CS159]|uniref:hypothetical protein n=1 Tax=Streptomyces sp. CS159 TaxID=1982762 RepID=UPI000B41D6BE|nr:hypothetical protein [Streptomyces sp. CS159]OWA16589.1 hypothetical protein B9W64_12555 [Streptomyces sp. CS159]